MSDDETQAIIDELDPTPATEALPVSRRQALRALAGVGALGVAPSGVAGQAGTVRADEAYFSNYDIEQTAAGVDLTIDGQTFSFDGSDTIGLPDGGQGTELVTPSGASASEVVRPSGEVVWEGPSPIIDGFEDQDLSEYSEDTDVLSTSQSQVFSGQYALFMDASGGTRIYSTGGLPRYPTQGTAFEYYVYVEAGKIGCGWAQSGAFDGYTVVFDNGTPELNVDNNTTLDSGGSYPQNVWLRLQITWTTNNEISVSCYRTDTGQQVFSLFAIDGTYTQQQGLKFGGNGGEGYFDSVKFV